MEHARKIDRFTPPTTEFDALLAGSSASMREVARAIGQLACTDVHLLLQGEHGTGRRVLAEAIHQQSPRGCARFFSLPSSGRSEAQVERELFGAGDDGGLFDAARGATLYLDDIAVLPLRLQRRLTRVLRGVEGCAGVRVIASTAVELEELMRMGRFLPELYFQLGLIRLAVPPLRERREDIEPMAEVCIRAWCRERGVPRIALSRAALGELTGYSWPGNARELQQTIVATLALTHGDEISAERIRTVLGRRPRRHAAPDVFPLRQLERDYIATVLGRCNWNQSLAARRLGIGRNTLMRKIKFFKLERCEAA